ncbi:hypothetical protein AALP_AA4G055800 [Arabis alpina]|uniref:NPH3 domain-containing protein n=1 Tax=Arabis alpina TaxID=50452 RepID=A0A087H1D1_ARAAL|nr:hypothetical protein AALP_AA4G055800 [Arabis alpina]
MQKSPKMDPFYDLQINLNNEYTFFLNKVVISKYSGIIRKMIKQTKKKKNNKIIIIEIDDFPGGPNGFELVSRFCYNNGEILINVSNVSTLYCCSVFLNMTEKYAFSNLLLQTEKFLQEVFYGSWNDVVSCLKNCDLVFLHADSYGLIDKLIFVALSKIYEFSSTLSPVKNTLESDKRPVSRDVSCGRSNVTCGRSNEWWFNDMSSLLPRIILKMIRIIGDYKTSINSLVLTRFLLHYLKTKLQTKSELLKNKLEYSVLADTAVKEVISSAENTFSCRKLFWILRVLSSFRLSKESRIGLETLIGEMLDQATLDDLLIPSGGSKESGYYNVDLVIRLLKVFVKKRLQEEEERSNMKEIEELIDKYLREISPDCNLKVSKFLGVAESLPDSARDCFDGIYIAIDIYLQSHPNLTSQDRTKLCTCLNYKKLTMETCKQLAKNPKIPPHIAIEALKSKCDNQEHKTPDSKVVTNSVSCRYSQGKKKKPVLLHLKGFEIMEKSDQGLKSSSRGFSRRVMDSFREGL